MSKWRKARKKPIVIEFREVEANAGIGTDLEREQIPTREGTLYAFKDRDYVIRGIKGELYPIKKEIFYETYDVIERHHRMPNGKLVET